MSRLIPPYVFLFGLIGIAGLWAVPLHPSPPYARPLVLWLLPLALGVLALGWARAHYIRRDMEIHTFKSPRGLVTDGPFAWSRNPMYLGFALLLLAAAFLVARPCALLIPAGFVGLCALWYIPHEERVLKAMFGPAYDAYTEATRRWI